MGQVSGGTRRHRRYQTNMVVHVKLADAGQLQRFVAENLSLGGMFLVGRASVEVGVQLEIRLRLPDGLSLRLPAEVVHVVHPSELVGRREGIGLRFLELRPEDAEHLRRIIREQVLCWAAGGDPPSGSSQQAG